MTTLSDIQRIADYLAKRYSFNIHIVENDHTFFWIDRAGCRWRITAGNRGDLFTKLNLLICNPTRIYNHVAVRLTS